MDDRAAPGSATTARPAKRQKYELHDEMPDEVRAGALRFTSIQALNELIGSLIYVPWVDRAPSVQRKQMLIAKVQDEIGHGHVVARLAADLGGGWEQVLADYLAGKSFLHNVFHYEFTSWEDFGAGGLLMNSAAIAQFKSLAGGVYLPYARALKKIAREESFHYQHSADIVREVMRFGSAAQIAAVRRSFHTWLPRVLAFLGPEDSDTVHANPMWQCGLKPDSNDAVRQQWLARIVPAVRKLGVDFDRDLVRERPDGSWEYAEPDWAEVKEVVRNGGPASADRLAHARRVLERNSAARRAWKRAA
ncbi:hypothetical protein F1721_12880 [Saccharopolyspora hirsuta]|uniref:1,2-phenylacetyl-CoA epoxidase subunit A n=1 Tax=Saccharopolyspora hirsuta TaxID=1837 RepID=A0A5M7BWE2_SACHI|nr:Phenylacetic acid catabolic protein [Saccharopolyspora hirsuta]KAA5834556.1 hypothetical protein F1721_12880 [Saccharopolyspora hirsuta]